MKSKYAIIKHSLREIKEMHDLIEAEIDDLLKMTNDKQEIVCVNTDEIKKNFGEFSYKEAGGGRIIVTDNWRNENIIMLNVNDKKLWCHKLIAPQLAGAIATAHAKGLLDEVDFSNGGGCYVPRHKNWNINSTLSKHSWGIAFDISPNKYPYGSLERINNDLILIFRRYGFYYGGDWRTPDPMHFEWCQFII